MVTEYAISKNTIFYAPCYRPYVYLFYIQIFSIPSFSNDMDEFASDFHRWSVAM